uniref:Ycf1 n=1 Tax=Pseudoderbesia arbuscula TaxID=2320809 RepID=A0A386AYJ6_9CHLO|nr:hypothetical protein Ycf1 [Pseudoderbesia arbuscula]
MSLAQEIKNYIEFFHTIKDPDTYNLTTSIVALIKYNFFYGFQCLKNLIVYIFSWNWLFDIIHVPITIPKWLSSNLKEIYSIKNPDQFLYSYSSNSIINQSNGLSRVLEGFFTSFFLCIPNSIIHILLLRRLIVEGLVAGLAAACGTLTGQLIFLWMIFLGFRSIIFAWFNLEPLTYIFGIFLVLFLVYQFAHQSIKRVRKNETQKLITIFLINFGLVWTEQYGLFPYISHLNIASGSSFFDLSDLPGLDSMSLYFIGFLVGSLLWMFVFGFIFLKISQFLAERIIKSYSQWIQKFNFICLTSIIAFCLASFPYYGMDYLASYSLGFYSQDSVFEPILLKTDIKDVQKGRLGEYSANSSIDTDIAPFDRGRYSTGTEIELTFEDMNFQGEYIWRSRSDRVASGSAGVVNRFMSKFLPSSPSQPLQTNNSSSINLTNSLQENFDSSPWFFYKDNYENFLERFITDYNAEVKDPSLPDPMSESENFSAFSELVKYGFDSFASLEEVESDEFEEELGKKIKYKYYNNPIYKFLITVDMQNFIRRQPLDYYLTSEEENLLFRKRLILTNYYNSLRSYSLLPYSETFRNLFGGTKSYANRVYNQQYKGTLKILRRLFLIDVETNASKNNFSTILKYDQPLFRDVDEKKNKVIHEELPLSSLHSELVNPYLQEVYPIPFYIGWDENIRKFILTNRLPLNKEIFTNMDTLPWKHHKTHEKSSIVQFTSWPLHSFVLETPDGLKGQFLFQKFNQSKSELQKDLFEYAEPGDYETHLIYDTLPSIVQRIDLRNKDKTNIKLKPTRSGFMWPPFNTNIS